ncbi:CBS domain-containing protein [Streptomyces mirabilis]|jgi:signal-transduction protein with cAMP-binding, CBS, and nucleotidyltransferase domain|uniref:CBS domain-containing protein n=1 Tax=Streptomyces mirabilis TaxID=68239 RepID=A0A1I2UA59_9ACTN|nr:CBS domain-containing protein [Streptomyces mirabilis]SFG73279.1 CBS domain-containing protein [Streptomyces mirabilis]
MKVSEVMTAPPISVGPHVSLLEVIRRMTESAVGSVLVVEDGALRGIVTDRDLAIRGVAEGLDRETRVDAVMSARVVTVDAGDDLQVAYRTFRRTGVRRLPVLDGGRVVGVLTIDDLFLDVFRRLADLLGPIASSMLQEPPGRPSATGARYEP